MGDKLSNLGPPLSKQPSDSIDKLNGRIEKETNERKELEARVPRDVKLKDKEVNDAFKRQIKLDRELSDLKEKHKTVKKERKEVQKRLNQIMESPSKDNTSSNTDDMNNKIPENFKALYENEWKKALHSLEAIEPDSHRVGILLNALRDVYEHCKSLANDGFFQQVERCIESPYENTDESNKPGEMPELLKQQINEFRKLRAMYGVKKIQKVLVPAIKIVNADSKVIQEYVSRCVEVCWLMVVQDPPLALEFGSADLFNNNMFNEYKEHGKYVEYVVWPALLQHHRGAILSKGIAQGSQAKKPWSFM